MLKPENRLRQKKDIDLVLKKGRSFFSEFLVLKRRENNLNFSRFAFVVSKAVSPKAVERNKVKRRLRETVRGNIEGIESGFDVIFFTKKAIKYKNYREIKNAVSDLLQKSCLQKQL